MATFYFIRHGEMDASMAGKKFYKGFAYPALIVVCHGMLMQYVLGIEHPENGQIAELIY